jgi:hypothetical protein
MRFFSPVLLGAVISLACAGNSQSNAPSRDSGAGAGGGGGSAPSGSGGSGGGLSNGTGGVLASGGTVGSGGTGGTTATGGSHATGGSAGTDGGGNPPCLLPKALPCHGTSTSTLPGVFTALLPTRCTYTVQEAVAGIDVPYTVVVNSRVPGVLAKPIDVGGCWQPDATRFETFVDVTGGGQHYCRCDIGLCHDPIALQADLPAGCPTGTVHWEGVNWSGPSDTNNPKGAPFPPGDYVVKIRQTGWFLPDASSQTFEIDATITVTITP